MGGIHPAGTSSEKALKRENIKRKTGPDITAKTRKTRGMSTGSKYKNALEGTNVQKNEAHSRRKKLNKVLQGGGPNKNGLVAIRGKPKESEVTRRGKMQHGRSSGS